MADAIISVVLEQLASIIQREAQQEVRLVGGVEEEVGKLTSNLQAIRAVLIDAEKRRVKNATVKQWLDKLKDVSYDMDDVLDEWNTAILKRQIEGVESASEPKRKLEGVESASKLKRKVCSFIQSRCFCFKQVALRRDIAIKIKDLNKRLDVIAIEKDRYNFEKGIEEPERQITASVIDVSKVYGRDHHKDTIVNMLLSESSQGQALRIISIVGMGGIGKTTLAQLVYNDDSVKAHFEKRIWVCVSDPFDLVKIAKAILEALTNQTPNLVELDSLLHNIHQSIKGKKFLLVLDDVWTEDPTKWEQLESSLKCGSQGSQILVTTRKENVAKIIGTTMFPLRQLSNDDCWLLFSHIAFSGRTPDEHENLEDIGRKIVEKCKGLPLAAKTLGSLLRLKKTREEWQRVLDNEVWELEEVEKRLFSFLLLSYFDLPFAMRQCFSYCAIFPKDYEIEKDELIKMWMAQGYLKATRTEDMEIIGEQYFDNLAMRSFFQDFEYFEDFESNESRKIYKIHDIVHDFAQFLTKNECFSVEIIGPEELRLDTSYEKARHLMMDLAGGVSFPTSVYNIKTLRSLLLKSRDLLVIGVALPKVFEQLTCLRTLHLSGDSLKEVPKEVGKLIHLRYLKLARNYQLEKLPETICDLCNLQTLNLSWCENLQNLPKGIGKLINLRHLEILRADKICFMPKGFVRLSSLRTLSNFIMASGDDDSEASTLGDLKNLNHLRGDLMISGLGNVGDMGEATKAQLKNKKHLVCVGLKFNFNGKQAGARINDEQVIEALQPPPNLKELGIVEYRGTTLFPNWMMSLTKLRRFSLANCSYCECLPPLWKLSSLESLSIFGMKSVKKVGFEFLGLEANGHNNNDTGPSMGDEGETSSSSSFIAFPKLKELEFYNMEEWEEWDYGITRRVSVMPCLCSLFIVDCPKLKSLPDHLLQTTTLEKLLIRECPILAECYYNDKTGEDWPKISHIPYIIINGEEVPK